MTDFKVVRENPPPPGHRGRPAPVMERLRELVAEPGTWARVATHTKKPNASQMVYDFRNGIRKVPPGQWEFSYGPIENTSEFGVWARYLGPEVAEKPLLDRKALRAMRARLNTILGDYFTDDLFLSHDDDQRTRIELLDDLMAAILPK